MSSFFSKTDGSITDDTRIREAVPTINYLMKAGAKVVLSSHCGRPDGKANKKYSLAPMAARLSECLSTNLLPLSLFLSSLLTFVCQSQMSPLLKIVLARKLMLPLPT